jgi:ParB/RepB/Spo0J family partition protein
VEHSNDECRLIPLDLIHDPWVLLRPVNVNSIEYLQIRDTIRDRRLLNSIAVRPSPRITGHYEVVDGMYRLTAFRELRKPAIPATVGNETDDEVLSAQIQANALRRETTPIEYARQILRIKKLKPGIVLSQLSVLIGREPNWIGKTLGLLNLHPDVQKLVEQDEVPLCNAYMLSKLPPRLQKQYVEHAIQMPTVEFDALATSVIRSVMEAARNGKLEAAFNSEFKPQPFLRPLKRVLEEIETHHFGAEHILRGDCKTPMEAWNAALKWAASMDSESIAKQQKAATRRNKTQRIERDSYQNLIESDTQPDRDND